MKFPKAFLTLLLAGLSLFAAAAELTFDLKVNRGAPVDCNPQVRKQTIAVFVIDCSGSMYTPYTDSKNRPYRGPSGKDWPWSRVRLLREKVLPERFEALPRGARVYAFLYTLRSDRSDWLIHLEYPEANAASLKKLNDEIARFSEQDPRNPKQLIGQTPYFDAMHKVLAVIEKSNLLNNPRFYLMLFNYTDGQNATGSSKYFSSRGKLYRFLYPSDHSRGRSCYEDELKDATDRFENRWKWKKLKEEIARKGFYEELNLGSVGENKGVKRYPSYKVVFACDGSALKNPKDAPAQKVPLYASFPVDRESWNFLVQNGQFTVKVQFGNGPVRSYPVSLGRSGNSFTVPVPAEAMNKEGAKVTVSFDCFRDEKDRFKLLSPAPVTFYLPGARSTVGTVTAGGMPLDGKSVMTVLKGKKIFFTAEGSAKNYVWKFLDSGKDPSLKFVRESANGSVVSCVFGRIGKYKFGVSSEGESGSEKSGYVEVVAIDLMIAPQDKVTEPGGAATFKAVVPPGNNLNPSNCKWYVVGPVVANAEGNPPVTRLVSGGLQNRYTFAKPGEYRIRVTAEYEQLPLETREAETPWSVSQPAAIAFADSMKGDGSTLDYRKQVELEIKVTAGEIDEKSIVWKAHGREIQRGTRKFTYTPKEKGLVVFSVEAKDRVQNRTETTSKPVAYSFGCGHRKPEVKVVDLKTGKGTWGVGAKLDFEVLSAIKYDKIKFEFYDDPAQKTPTETKLAANGHADHTAAGGGEFRYKLTCVCKNCGESFSKEDKLVTLSQAPRPLLELKENKKRCYKGDTVTLQDNGDKEGDYVKCRLYLKDPKGEFVGIAVLEKGFQKEQITLGDEKKWDGKFAVPKNHWTDFELKLVPLDGKGKEIKEYKGKPVQPSVLTISVRPPLWVSLLLLAIGIAFFIVLICLMKKFLFGNGPCAWTLYYMRMAVLVQNNLKDKEKFASRLRGESNVSLRDYWNVWTLGEKKAVIPASELFPSFVGDDDTLTIDSNGEIDYNNGGFKKVSHFTLPVDNSRQSSPIFEQKNKNGKQQSYLYLLLDRNETDTHYEIWFYVLCFFSLAVVAVAVWLLLLK